ncbi:hypothetical protein BXZ70DRAFT_960361 [Cristinia sonorae]|uniref:DUF1746 domain-containing protein n=1 Tax=Cristinia sonorae TaxID=1940300 RepID=A0A8K0UF30_9AGAR|nr:hypothetical protein BXZ70DRAFT_960361 [Cristinia sonorae]
MHIRHAQRKHIIHSLDTLLYQLHALSFFLSPYLWPYLCRVIAQSQFQRPQDVDQNRSLRFWFFLVLFFNIGSVWTHATTTPSESRSVILDFVGMAHTPSKLHLLTLDFAIIILTMLLTFIAYETSLLADMPSNTTDPLQPKPNSATSSNVLPFDNHKVAESPYVMDVRLSPILDRLRNPAPPPRSITRSAADRELLPLPNVVPWQRLLRRARANARERTRQDAQQTEMATEGEGGGRRIPGGLDDEGT